MSPRAIKRLLGIYAIVLFVACVIVRTSFAPSKAHDVVVTSYWQEGKRVRRDVTDENSKEPHKELPAPCCGITQANEHVIGEAPILMHPQLFDLALVPGLDGLKASIGDKVAYATVDDLLATQAYDRSHLYADAGFGWGVHRPTVMHILSQQLGVSPSELETKGTFKRVRFERRLIQPVTSSANSEPRPEHLTEERLTRELVTDALRAAATHLAQLVDGNGRFRYMVDAPTNATLAGYNWPRHSGATFFLAQAAAVLEDPLIRYACLRAASTLRDATMQQCGKLRCIATEDPMVEIGSSALALIAFTEIVRTNADGAYRPAIADLAAFLRSQQREDGELMHQYDRRTNQPVDVQFLYYSGEATLALARAHAITNDPRDLDAARRALSRISGSGWSFFGSRYYFSEEHWTCQAVAELWERAPDRGALDFCARWHEYQRRLQLGPSDTPFDGDGAFSFGPLVSPRITPASSRGEAAGALYDVLLREQMAGRTISDPVIVQHELDRALAFVLRHQFRRQDPPMHLFANPVAVRGAVPGSPVDYQLRIDYAQHAGSMMIRWLEVHALAASKAK